MTPAPLLDVPLLDVRGLRTEFRTRAGTVRAVDGVSFAVPPGGALGIVGESGSGKSVTSLSIMRLVDPPGVIAAGEVLFGGQDLLRLPERAMREVRGRRICLVFQDPMTALNPVYTVGDQVAEALEAHGGTDSRARTLALFQALGIPAPERRVDAYPHQLSGGMRQRVVIAMALANRPDLLILDEPTTALDVTIQAQILDLVRALRRDADTAVVLITHDIGVIQDVCEEVVVMYGGRVMEHGPVGDVVADPKHPYTQGLLGSIPTRAARGQRLTVIPGSVPNPLRPPPGCPFQPRCPRAMPPCTADPGPRDPGDGRRVACWLY